MNAHRRYQLIEPYVGQKVYESSSLKKGAKKCYDELKISGKKTSHFTIMDIESYQKYTFGIGSIGGGTDGTKKSMTNGKIDELEMRIQRLEKMMIPQDGPTMESYKIDDYRTKKDDVCVLL